MSIFNSSNGVPDSSGGGIPSGLIAMWSGTSVPDGWYLCNGENGTPDLRGRFVLGSSDTHALATTGGEETVKLTIYEMPKHSHSYDSRLKGSIATSSGFGALLSANTGIASPSTSWDTGGSQPHNNMPPFYVLAYIMKA